MSAFTNLLLDNQEEKIIDSKILACEDKTKCIIKNFKKLYSIKKYDKQNFDHIEDFIKNGKLVISESWKNNFAKDEVLIKIFITLKMYQSKKITLYKNDLITKFGFKKTTINLALKKLLLSGLLDRKLLEQTNKLKLLQMNLRFKGEPYVVIKGQIAMQILLLKGLKTAWYYIVQKHKSKVLNGSKYFSYKDSCKVLLKNNYFKDLSRDQVYKMHSFFARLFGFNYHQIYKIVRTATKQFMTFKKESGQEYKKFIGYLFETKKYLIMKF